MKKLIAISVCALPLIMSPVAFAAGGDAGTVSNSQPGTDTPYNTGNNATKGGSMDTLPPTPGGHSTNDQTAPKSRSMSKHSSSKMNHKTAGEKKAEKSNSTKINGNNGAATGQPRSQSGSN